MRKESPENGLHINYYEHGQLMSVWKKKDGLRHGEFISWYESGQKKCQGNFEDDEFSGKWTYWNENGEIEGSSFYALINYKKFIRPHIAIIFILLVLKIILGFLDVNPFISDPVISISGILIGIFGGDTYKGFIRALTLISLVAIIIIQYQLPVLMPMSAYIMSFFDILLIALVANILILFGGGDSHQGSRSIKNREKQIP